MSRSTSSKTIDDRLKLLQEQRMGSSGLSYIACAICAQPLLSSIGDAAAEEDRRGEICGACQLRSIQSRFRQGLIPTPTIKRTECGYCFSAAPLPYAKWCAVCRDKHQYDYAPKKEIRASGAAA